MLSRDAVKLGKLPPRDDPRTLRLDAYLAPDIPEPPQELHYARAVSAWGMMRNDRVGDCAVATPGHLIQAWTANRGAEHIPSDDDIIAAYAAISGYDPATGANDRGCVVLDVLNYWRAQGIAGHRIGAYVAVDPRQHEHLKTAAYLFGGIYFGLALPLTAEHRSHWTVEDVTLTGNAAPGSWGGHAVPALTYDAQGVRVITWGVELPVSWAFVDTYCEEAYAILSPDWVDGTRPAPNGFALLALQADLEAVTS